MEKLENQAETEKQPEENSEESGNFISGIFSTKLANIMFILLSLGLVVGVLINFWLNNQFDLMNPLLFETETNEYVEEEETVDWKSYIDYEHKFSINYPDTWDFKKLEPTEEISSKVMFYNKTKEGDNPKNHVDVTVYFLEPGLKLRNKEYLSSTNVFTYREDYVMRYELIFENEESLTQELRDVYLETFREMLGTYEVLKSQGECKPTGCSNQICSDEEVITTCEYSEVFACYEGEVCERQPNGTCGWTMSDRLRTCLKEAAGVKGVKYVDPVVGPEVSQPVE